MTENDVPDLLLYAIQMVGRLAAPPDQVRAIVGNNKRLIKAFNLCDGRHIQKEIIRTAGLHQSSFSRTSARWVANGIAFRIGSGNGDGRETKLLHIYPIPESDGRGRPKHRIRRPKKK